VVGVPPTCVFLPMPPDGSITSALSMGLCGAISMCCCTRLGCSNALALLLLPLAKIRLNSSVAATLSLLAGRRAILSAEWTSELGAWL
jgi:hypothetical protein